MNRENGNTKKKIQKKKTGKCQTPDRKTDMIAHSFSPSALLHTLRETTRGEIPHQTLHNFAIAFFAVSRRSS